MMKTGMLLISNPNIVFRVLPVLQNEINNTIYVQYFPPNKWSRNLMLKNVDGTKKAPNWTTYSSSLIGLYSKMLPYKHLDIRILLSGIKSRNLSTVQTKKPVEVVYYDQLLSEEEVHKYVISCVQNKTSNCQVIALSNEGEIPPAENNYSAIQEDMYENVVLGGTFDRLHYGHKILLSEAILRCEKKITVGVTDTQMLKSKKVWELVEPVDVRIQNVRDFLEEVDPSLEYNIVPINDVFGPTKDDPTFQMIVVSSETVGGGGKINEIRKANGLDPLCIHTVELLADPNKEDEEEEDKISSSNLRLRCLGTLLRAPQPNPRVPERPYIIGLTGGIASGKTNISDHLEALGAGVINCDQLGHYVYRKGTLGYQQVVEHFGQEILDESGAIDRRKLGTTVFNDKEKLDTLNKIVWPLIIEEAMTRARQLHAQGHQVVVLDAAVLIRAQWTQFCHEIWVSIVPPQEAIKRIMERNALTEEAAKTRVESLPSNIEQVQLANIVFCTLWRTEFTKKQVKKAWTSLKERLNIE